nr:hypothetical protein Iba_chr01bCG3550 [Ipomoea batatas]
MRFYDTTNNDVPTLPLAYRINAPLPQPLQGALRYPFYHGYNVVGGVIIPLTRAFRIDATLPRPQQGGLGHAPPKDKGMNGVVTAAVVATRNREGERPKLLLRGERRGGECTPAAAAHAGEQGKNFAGHDPADPRSPLGALRGCPVRSSSQREGKAAAFHLYRAAARRSCCITEELPPVTSPPNADAAYRRSDDCQGRPPAPSPPHATAHTNGG